MEYRIEIEEHSSQKVIHTIVTGDLSESDRNRIAIETSREMKNRSISKAIWDIRDAKLSYSLIGSHEVVLNLAALGMTPNDSIAVVYFHDREQHEHARIAAHNRGTYNIDYFLEMPAAIEWLISRS